MNAPAEKVINKLGMRIAQLECDNAMQAVALEEAGAQLSAAKTRIVELESGEAPKPKPPREGTAHA